MLVEEATTRPAAWAMETVHASCLIWSMALVAAWGGDSIGVGLVLQGYDEFDFFSWEAATWALATLSFVLSL
jgi:hypothetical protein